MFSHWMVFPASTTSFILSLSLTLIYFISVKQTRCEKNRTASSLSFYANCYCVVFFSRNDTELIFNRVWLRLRFVSFHFVILFFFICLFVSVFVFVSFSFSLQSLLVLYQCSICIIIYFEKSRTLLLLLSVYFGSFCNHSCV